MMHSRMYGILNPSLCFSKIFIRRSSRRIFYSKLNHITNKINGFTWDNNKYISLACSNKNVCKYHKIKKSSSKQTNISELSTDKIGEYVELVGTLKLIRGTKLLLTDETGYIWVIVKKRDDLLETLESLEPYSKILITGFVEELPSQETNRKDGTTTLTVIIDSMKLVKPPKNNVKSNDSLILPLHPKELSRSSPGTLIYFFQRSHNCGELDSGKIGKHITLFGWVVDKENEKQITLEDGYGSISLVCPDENVNLKQEMKNVNTDALVLANGILSRPPDSEMNHSSDDSALQLTLEAMKVINDSDTASEGANLVQTYLNSNKSDQTSLQFKDSVEKSEAYTDTAFIDYNRFTIRSHNCGELNESHVGHKVILMGWVKYIRLNRFIILMDKYGSVQLLFSETLMKNENQNILDSLSVGSVVSVEGVVSLRPQEQINNDMATGKIEINVTNINVINKASQLPFYVKDKNVSSHTQLKYRYLCMRQNSQIQANLKFRCDLLFQMRKLLVEKMGFLEVETPTLFKRTPGGAQEFIVPTKRKGEFYALVQSPQQFKQLLMIGAIDKYFQFARCYRDETFDKARQPEFTQLDLEMSFCDREGILSLMENLLESTWPKSLGKLVTPFPRLTYEEAMVSYGSDKPDLRLNWKLVDLTDMFQIGKTDCCRNIDIEKYRAAEDFASYAFIVPNGLVGQSKIRSYVGDKGIQADCKIYTISCKTVDKTDKDLKHMFAYSVADEIKCRAPYQSGDLLILGFGPKYVLLNALGELRLGAAKYLTEAGVKIYEENDPFRFLWVVDFPLFGEVEGKVKSYHHPFTQPHPDDIDKIKTEPLKARSLHYDLVLNGNEIGGGSIRVHNADLQKYILENILKLDCESLDHLLQALQYGAPIHGGFALGIDRYIAILCGSQAISEVIAFPKFYSGTDPLSGAPCELSDEDKAMYHIS